jgi:hypothetical protein
MAISAELLLVVRQRAGYQCEYCGVTEVESGGNLTIDHYRPVSADGSDDIENLVYACFRCNIYKSDYRPLAPADTPIWNPRGGTPLTQHVFCLEDGHLLALTDTGHTTIELLRLNRRPLVDSRLRAMWTRREADRLARLVEITKQLSRLKAELGTIANEETRLLDEQRQILEYLRKHDR